MLKLIAPSKKENFIKMVPLGNHEGMGTHRQLRREFENLWQGKGAPPGGQERQDSA